jgi:hypothetical protein
VIEHRRHSVEDLLKFLEHSDMPIADDGSIIAYKILRHSPRGESGVFVDCHTRKVTQRVGSYVCVDENLVDLNRDRECSNGLHIARRGYIGGFGGDVCVLTKVAPEDVMTVPHRDANKVRVKGYHIIFELPMSAYDKLKSNRPMTEGTEVSRMLSRAVSGDHPPIIERVQITQQQGGGLVITPLVRGKAARTPKALVDDTTKVSPREPQAAPAPAPKKEKPVHTAIDDTRVQPKASPKEIAQKQTGSFRKNHAQQLLDQVVGPNSNTEQRRRAAVDLLAFKKKAKVGWSLLGIDEGQVAITKTAEAATEAATVKAPPPPKRKPVEPAPAESIIETPKELPTSNLATARDLTMRPANVRTRAIQTLLDQYDSKTLPTADRKSADRGLLDFRKKQKKSWAALGFPQLDDAELKAFIETVGNITPESATPTPAPKGEGNRQMQARELFNQRNWTALLAFKKKAKVSWERLGFTAANIAEIKQHIGD